MHLKPLALALVCCTAFGMHSGSAAAAYGPHSDDTGFALMQGHKANVGAHYARKRHEGYTAAQLRDSPAAMDEFCRGNENIEFTTACAPYRD